VGNTKIDFILSRRSVRTYTPEPVSEDHVRALLKAAMAAPSASNLKPWHFVVITDRRTLNELADILPHGKMLRAAPAGISVLGDTAVSDAYWVQDCSAATENLLLAASAVGLGAVWLGVYPRESRVVGVTRLLGLPAGTVPLNVIAVGHPAEVKPPRTQYDDSRVHAERW
jgi:nitroreductase